MPEINPRTRRRTQVRHITRLYKENEETLFAYGAFIKEDPAYVLNELIEKRLETDEEYKTWRAEHPQSFVPPRRRGKGKGKRPRGSWRAGTTRP